MSEKVEQPTLVWAETPALWAMIGLAIAVASLAFRDSLAFMVSKWIDHEEYSYGYLVPFISMFFIWQRRQNLASIEFKGDWRGVALIAVAVVLFTLGDLASLYILQQYAFLLVVFGAALALTGLRAARITAPPLLLLAFMIPLPEFLLNNISAQLQLWSSQLGVWVVRLFGISVFLEGNVIDLGKMKLQVVEACGGLRYLFPLMTFGFIAAYLFQSVWWKRVTIFLSTIPITIVLNSLRIGLIGVAVEYWGRGMAEGLLHDFEGWAVFMACAGLLFAEMWWLARLGKNPLPLRVVFGFAPIAKLGGQFEKKTRGVPRQFQVAIALIVAILAISWMLPQRVEDIPVRQPFSLYPMQIGEWQGRDRILTGDYIEALKLDDYLLADYSSNGQTINFYSAYYQSQRKGQSAHSPRSCLPGGGWRIREINEYDVPSARVGANPLRVNRALVQMGDETQVIYYWFQQRGRVITNEWAVKWFLFLDGIRMNRSDGALIRLSTLLRPGENAADADARLAAFARDIGVSIEKYVPGSKV